MKRVLLFDLDETLVVEEPAAVAAFEATARSAASSCGVEASTLAAAARARARELWRSTPVHAYCLRVGISSWEGLWCRFEGDDPNATWLREWSPTYRRETWRLALNEQGIQDRALAEELGERFGTARRARHEVFTDVPGALQGLSEEYMLAVVTNGASCLQREKLAACGLVDQFAAVVVSAEVGVGKPDAAIFQHALAQLDRDGRHAVMVGDSLSRDVNGAVATGIDAVWVNRFGRVRPNGHPQVPEIATLTDLSTALNELN